VENKSRLRVFEGVHKIEESFPFPILVIDSDNGDEFINDHFLKYCEQRKITFTRSRPYRKNDNCYVEQKNYSVVRKTIGYYRYDTEEELKVINQIYRLLKLYTNFFQPTMRLIEKTRTGSKVKKRYDTSKTPYRRLMESLDIPKNVKVSLTKQYESLNPVKLKREITSLQNRLFDLIVEKMEIIKGRKRKDEKEEDFVYNFNEATNYNFV